MLHVTPTRPNLALVENIVAETKDSVRAAQLVWLRDVLTRSGLSQTELARRIKRDPSTLAKFLSTRARAGHTLQADIIEAISRVTSIPTSRAIGAAAPTGMREAEATPYQALPNDGSDVARMVASMLADRNAVDPWTIRSRALETAGIMPGDVLLVDLNEHPRSGDVVCAQLYDAAGDAETVFRIFERPFLTSATYDRSLMRPHLVDDDRVVIRGTMITSIRPRLIA